MDKVAPNNPFWDEIKKQMDYLEAGARTLDRARADYERTGLRSDKMYYEDVSINYTYAWENLAGLLHYANYLIVTSASSDLKRRLTLYIHQREAQQSEAKQVKENGRRNERSETKA